MRQNQEQLIYAQLEKDILGGKYEANERLPGIPELAKLHQVSYGTAHAVVRRLAKNRLVVVEPGRGSYVLGDRPVGVEWLWFVGGSSINNELFDNSTRYLKAFWDTGQAKRTTLNLSFLDVRNLPPPDTLARASRDRGIRGLLVCGHGTHHIDYVDALGKLIPVVSLFGHWEGHSFHYVAPDFTANLDEFLKLCPKDGKNIGFLSFPLAQHPNYERLFDALRGSEGHPQPRKEDCFFGVDQNDAVNWMIGRLSRPEAPRKWIAAVPGLARAALDAAAALKLKPGKDIHVLTFSMLHSDYECLGGRASFGVHQFELTVDTGLDKIIELILAAKKRSEGKSCHVPMEFLPAVASDD